jgi:hypothetical protein
MANEQQYSEQEIQENAAAFDHRFGESGYELLNGTPEQTQDYKFSAKATDGREVEQALTASSPDMATLQAWDVIQQHQRNGTEIQTARIDWSNDEGPQVSHIYDRTQGFELSRPDGVELQNNPAAGQMRNIEDNIRQQNQQTQPATPAQVATLEHAHEHHHHSPANRQHEEQQHHEHSIGFGH